MEIKLHKKKKIERVKELEDQLLVLLEISSYYDDLPSIFFDTKINDILNEIERLEGVK